MTHLAGCCVDDPLLQQVVLLIILDHLNIYCKHYLTLELDSLRTWPRKVKEVQRGEKRRDLYLGDPINRQNTETL